MGTDSIICANERRVSADGCVSRAVWRGERQEVVRVDRDLRVLLLQELERGLPDDLACAGRRRQLEAQPRRGEVNLHGGAVLDKINTVAPTSTSISESAAFTNIAGDACTGTPVKGIFCGSRYVYHVTDQQLGVTNAAYQAAILAQVGVQASGGTPSTGYCGGKYASQITTFGFKTLSLKTTAQSTVSDPVSGSSHCRQF